MSAQTFRIGVIVAVRGPDGRFLIFERSDIPGQWQFPQGGADIDEELHDAAWRELFEETGLTAQDVVAVAEFPEWVVYEYPLDLRSPKGRRGQAHRWFLFEAVHGEIEPMPDGSEFVAWRWADPDWILDNVVDFRKPGYRQVMPTFSR